MREHEREMHTPTPEPGMRATEKRHSPSLGQHTFRGAALIAWCMLRRSLQSPACLPEYRLQRSVILRKRRMHMKPAIAVGAVALASAVLYGCGREERIPEVASNVAEKAVDATQDLALNGTVATDSARKRAAEPARATEGVEEVHNSLTVPRPS
jgi:outer membrane murein-binding lipoprotein Lpp